ncbi:hypothetical protein AK812_SmicGene48607 [Symbiodinium microadriaticum]|uniref:Uncharacterized protein n=1 Tax=Symbiodinium microadriaticum TaxID=2951 RepID=A0A1Q9AGR8_SYMMI|nr:hypothetical protein AK812_SmicGene48607 [Symbiodinium microadriaticum]
MIASALYGEISSASKQLADPEVRERVQREAEKTLKKLGWPENEHAMEAASSLPKSILCITRRLARLTDIQSQLEKYMPPPPPENAPPEVKEKYNKGIRQKILVAIVPNFTLSVAGFGPGFIDHHATGPGWLQNCKPATTTWMP